MQSPEEGMSADLLSALQTLQGQTLESSDLKSLEELFQKWNLPFTVIKLKSQVLSIVNSSYKSTFHLSVAQSTAAQL